MPAISVLRLVAFYIVAILVAVGGSAKAAQGTYSDAQLQLLFSGSEVNGNVNRACLENPEPSRVISVDWNFVFNADGTLSIRYICQATYQPVDRSDTGTWRVQNNELCVDSESDIFSDHIHGGIQCWPVKKGRLFFEGTLPDSSTYWYFKIDNPKYSSKKELLAALKNIRGQSVAQTTVPLAAQPSAPPSAQTSAQTTAAADMAKDLATWKAVENSTRIDDFQDYLNAHPQGRFATLATVKIAQLAALSAARQQQELTAWQAIQGSTRAADFEAYLSRYPGGLFAGVAAERVVALQAQATAPKVDEDLALWQRIGESGDIAGLNAYLGQFPNGKFAAEARQRINTLAEAERKQAERTLWASVKDSRSMADVQSYLAKFPAGLHATEARARVAILEKFASVANVDFGNYHALIIGIDEYENLPNLKTAVNDAQAIADVLADQYGFQVRFLKNPNRGEILDAFDEYREKLGFRDNLLIYYAGHGWLDEEADRGYWLPADAKPNRRRFWVSNADIIDTLKTLQSKHVIVIADSCFSGTLLRGADIGLKGGDYWRRMAEKPARVAITSGSLEPVADAGGGGHSPFALAFIDALESNEVVIDGTSLFNAIRRPVMVAAQQTPQYSDVRNAGHDGGDFLFVRKQ